MDTARDIAPVIVAVLAVVGSVCAFIGFGWHWIALPQITLLMEKRLDQMDEANTTRFRRVHERLDAHLQTHAAKR